MTNVYLVRSEWSGASEPAFNTLNEALVAARAEADNTGCPVSVFEAPDGGAAREHTVVFPYVEEGATA